MNIPASARSAGMRAYDAQDLLHLALISSFAGTGLDQFLRTPPAQFAVHPGARAEHWITASLLTLPLFAVAVWGGDWIAGRAGIGLGRRPEVIKRALIIALLAAVAVMPAWFEASKTDGLARAQALVTPGSHGSPDVYWVSAAVMAALLCVCLVPAAAWAGRCIAARIRLPGSAGTAARGAVTVALLAAVPVAAWLLQQAAEHAYASQVSYTSASAAVPVQPHAVAGRTRAAGPGAVPPATAAPFAFGYQAAHALEDGLAGQAAGFPLIAVSLLRITRRAARRLPESSQHQQSVT